MLKQIYPELGEKAKGDILARYGAFSGKWKLYTDLDLKGRGIKAEDLTGKSNSLKKKSYWATDKAFESLCNKYEVVQNVYFD